MIKRLFKHPWIIISIITVITIFFAIQLPNIEIDNDYFNFVPKSQSSLIATKAMEKQFGGQDIIDIAVQSREGSIISKEGLLLVRDLTRKLEETINVADVISLTNSDFIAGTEEGMEVIPLIDKNFTGSPKEIQTIRYRLLSWDMYRRNLISDDFASTQIAVKLKDNITQEEEKQTYREIKKLISNYDHDRYNFYIAGMPSIVVLISQNVNRDLITLIPFVLLVVLLILFLSFKRFTGVILPTITVVVSTTWTLGLMALLHVKLTIIGTIIPILLVAVGSAYGIHIIERISSFNIYKKIYNLLGT